MKQPILILLLTLLTSFAAFAGDEVNTTYFGNKAVKGYDVVAYFTEDKAVKGKKELSTEHAGANYYFSSQKNLDLFKASPAKYLPQYGGYCAYAVGAKNTTADIDPTQFSVIDGKLYLNYNKKIQKIWTKDRTDFITKGDKNWSTLETELKD